MQIAKGFKAPSQPAHSIGMAGINSEGNTLFVAKNGKIVDRSTAVKEIYPRFLYIFSDIICLVTRNPKAWAETALQLLEWSDIGAHNTVNQYVLPAAIIVLNQPTIEDKRWISADLGAATEDFFAVVEKEIEGNNKLRAMASKASIFHSLVFDMTKNLL